MQSYVIPSNAYEEHQIPSWKVLNKTFTIPSKHFKVCLNSSFDEWAHSAMVTWQKVYEKFISGVTKILRFSGRRNSSSLLYERWKLSLFKKNKYKEVCGGEHGLPWTPGDRYSAIITVFIIAIDPTEATNIFHDQGRVQNRLMDSFTRN